MSCGYSGTRPFFPGPRMWCCIAVITLDALIPITCNLEPKQTI